MIKKFLYIILLIVTIQLPAKAVSILIPMDEAQDNHLKAYGIAFWILEKGVEIDWLLNYRGGSYLAPYNEVIENECVIRNVSYEVITDVQVSTIKQHIAQWF